MALPLPTVPDGWSLTSLMLHNETDITPNDPKPFAAMIMVQQRIDAPNGVQPTDVMAGDIVALEGQLPGFNVKQSGVDEASKLRVLEFEYSAEGHDLTQLVVYVPAGERLFTVTLTAKRGSQFDKLRSQAVSIARGKLA